MMINNTRDIDTSRRCKFCDVVLTDENQYPSMRRGFVCKVCHNKRSVAWQKAHYAKTENDKNVPDKSVLCRMYVDERKTLKDIGDIYISNKLFPDIDKKFTDPRSASPSMPRTQ
jgi:hypothetical protein